MPGNLCEHCVGMCCRYLAVPIDTPEDEEDFDDIRWYLLHEGVSVFVEDGDWYLYLAADCRYLQPDFRCGIYANRPRICRQYTTENCDYHSGDYGWEHHFSCPQHLEEYLRTHHAVKRSGRGVNGRPRSKGKAGRAGRSKKGTDYAAAKCDCRGRPLPSLEVRR